jgi:hypothetical protein
MPRATRPLEPLAVEWEDEAPIESPTFAATPALVTPVSSGKASHGDLHYQNRAMRRAAASHDAKAQARKAKARAAAETARKEVEAKAAIWNPLARRIGVGVGVGMGPNTRNGNGK